MSENKRFTIGDKALQEVYTGCIPAILDGGIPCTQTHILKLLNELYEENEELKSKRYNDTVTDLETQIMHLKEENEELKQQNYELIKLIEDLGHDEMDKQMEGILNG